MLNEPSHPLKWSDWMDGWGKGCGFYLLDTSEDHAAIQSNIGRLEKSVDRNLLQFSWGKFKVMLERNNPMHQWVLETTQGCCVEKEPRWTWASKVFLLNMGIKAVKNSSYLQTLILKYEKMLSNVLNFKEKSRGFVSYFETMYFLFISLSFQAVSIFVFLVLL